jgi:beta-glucanase (GH16 family)
LWSTGWFHPNGISGPINDTYEQDCYDPSQISTLGGELDLGIIADSETCETPAGPVTEPYAGSIVTTNGNFSYTYGFLEARVWLPGNGAIADWPSIWADGADWPMDGELDVLEGLGGLACYHFHYGASDATEQGPGNCVGTDYTGGWHTFAADWEPGVVTWYYDGIDIGSLNEGITDSPMYLVLNLAQLPPSWGAPILSPATMRVAYVRVWQHS